MRNGPFSSDSRRSFVLSSFTALGLHAVVLFGIGAFPAASQKEASEHRPAPDHELIFSSEALLPIQPLVAAAASGSSTSSNASAARSNTRVASKQSVPKSIHDAVSVDDFAEDAVFAEAGSILGDAPVRRTGMRGSWGTGSDNGDRDGRDQGASGSGRAPTARLQGGAQCADLFPHQAESELGVVVVELTVDASGTSRFSKIVDEQPLGQGFGGAARKCAQRLRFSPPENVDASSGVARPIIKLEFEKSS